MSWKELFTGSAHAEAYSKFRPTYPTELYTTIMAYMGQSERYSQAIDVGCGTGQVTRDLSPYFSHVMGTDVSESQVEEAVNVPNTPLNVQYRVGNFDNLFLADGSADLVTSALAAHWFDPIESFYTEVDRVLRCGGVLAVFGYGMPRVHCQGYDQEKLTDLMWDFYNDERMQQFVNSGHREVTNHYKSFTLPYPMKRIDCMQLNKTMLLGNFLGYLSTWSFYRKYVDQNKHETDPISELAKKYQKLFGKHIPLEQTEVNISWPIFLLLGKKS